MPLLTDLNVSPYFDDFDPNKNYYRTLFKPRVPVQARELSGIQSMLQNQIEKFGDSIYYHGSVVKGGTHTFDQSLYSVKIQNTYNSVVISNTIISNSIGLFAVGATSNVVNVIRKGVLRTSTEPNILIYKSVVGAGKVPLFQDGEVISLYTDYTDTSTLIANVQADSSNSSGRASIFAIDKSTYYINGVFVDAPRQEVVVNNYVISTNCTIGYNIVESIVSYLEDETLLDNALGYSNYNAPGADRLKIDLVLTTATQNTATSNTFVAVAAVEDGLLMFDTRTPLYSVIGDTMARRTYETSGDFTTGPFTLVLKDVSTANGILFGKISGTTAFVKGYEYTFINPLTINLLKARSTDSVIDGYVQHNYGNYTKVTSVAGELPTFDKGMEVELHSTANLSAANTFTKIGKANIRSFDYESGDANTTAVYQTSLFNIRIANSTGPVTNVSFTSIGNVYNIGYTGTATGYKNTDIVTVKSPIGGGDATATVATNATGGSLTFTITSNGFGFFSNSSPVISITAANGAKTSGTGATLYANVTYATGYDNTDIVVIASPEDGGNAYINIATNSTGGALTLTIDSAGYGFTTVNVSSNVFIQNSSGGDTNGTGALILASAGARVGVNNSFGNVRSMVVVTNNNYASPVFSAVIANGAIGKANVGPIVNVYTTGATAAGYKNTDTITITSPSGVNATATISTNATGGNLAITITNTGTNFPSITTFSSAVTNSSVLVKVANSSGGNSTGTGAVFYAVSGAANSALLFDSKDDSLLFPLGQKNIATSESVSYTYRKKYSAVQFYSGSATIYTTSLNETFIGEVGYALDSYDVVKLYQLAVINSAGSGVYQNGQVVSLDGDGCSVFFPIISSTSFSTVTITVNDPTFSGTADIIASVRVTADIRKTKNLQKNAVLNTPSIYPGEYVSMGVCDIYGLRAVYDISSANYMGEYSNTTSYANTDAITSNGVVYISQISENANNDLANTQAWVVGNNVITSFTYDNGQRNTHYDYGILKNIGSGVTGNTVVIFDYFLHSGGKGYFSVDSYPVAYEKIPSYTTAKGNITQLRDVYDFRPRRTDTNVGSYVFPTGSNSYSFDTFQLPIRDAFSYLSSSHSYYLSRIDKIILGKDGKFVIKSGVPAYVTPQYPADNPDGLTMFVLEYPAYTFSPADVKIQTIPHKRYTMKDIGSLDQRLTSVEYYTALTMGEQQLQGGTVAASNGVALFKSGYLVDAFAGHAIGEVTNPDYKCAIDFNKNYLRPMFESTSVGFDTSNTPSTMFVSNNFLMLGYTEVPFLSHTYYSEEEHECNPHHCRGYRGHIHLKQDRDHWYDHEHHPEVERNDNDCNNNWVKHPYPYGTEWDDWRVHFCGYDESERVKGDKDNYKYQRFDQDCDNSLADLQRQLASAQKTYNDLLQTNPTYAATYLDLINRLHEEIQEYSQPKSSWLVAETKESVSRFVAPGDPRCDSDRYEDGRVFNECVTHYCRPIEIEFQAHGLAPLTRHHVYVNGLMATGHCRNRSFEYEAYDDYYHGDNHFERHYDDWDDWGAELVTDRHGRLRGEFYLPNTDRFKIMARDYFVIEISDNLESCSGSTSYAYKKFHIKGRPKEEEEFERCYPKPVEFLHEFTEAIGAALGFVEPEEGHTHVRCEEQSGFYNSNTYSHHIQIRRSDCRLEINEHYRRFGESWYESVTDNDIDDIYKIHVTRFGRPPCIGEHVYHLRRWKRGYKTLVDIDDELRQYHEGRIFHCQHEGVDTDDVKVITTKNPLSQKFTVDKSNYPNGVYLTSVEVAFSEVDEYEPVHCHMRPWDPDDHPHDKHHIRHSHCTKLHHECHVYDPNDEENTMTKFTFEEPIYFAPGEYSFCIDCNGGNYKLHAGTFGGVDYKTKQTITPKPYFGPVYKCNSSKWEKDETTLLKIVLNKAKFNTSGSVTYPLLPYTPSNGSILPFKYNIVNPLSDDTVVVGVTSVSHQIQSRITSSNTFDGMTTVNPNQNFTFGEGRELLYNLSGEMKTALTLKTTDVNITPKVSLNKLSAIMVGNRVNSIKDPALAVFPETLKYGGGALAKYETKPVTLVQTISANSLRVWLDLNLQNGTNVEVYYKILNNYDNTAFIDRPWVKMADPDFQRVNNEEDFIEHAWIWEAGENNPVYSATFNGATSAYPDFQTFSVKVVMYSDNPSIVPKCQNLRVIAAAL